MNTMYRGRRLRSTPVLRDLVRETGLTAADLVMPYIVVDTDDRDFRREVESMPGQFQLSPEQLKKRIAPAVDKGLKAVILFGVPRFKDERGSEGWNPNGVVQRTVAMLKREWPELLVMTDVCLCEYTSHGHCGLLSDRGEIMNDPTVELLAGIAVSHARAGADLIAPSDMMDGRIAAIRAALDREGFVNLPVVSYAVKYASVLYGPFGKAAESTPKSGDRKSCQMDVGNAREALREANADLAEGADLLMVKPAGCYQDIIRLLADSFDVPIAAYQVSAEYSMIRAAGRLGWIDEEKVVLESLLGIRRAGASIILSYFTEMLLLDDLIR